MLNSPCDDRLGGCGRTGGVVLCNRILDYSNHHVGDLDNTAPLVEGLFYNTVHWWLFSILILILGVPYSIDPIMQVTLVLWFSHIMLVIMLWFSAYNLMLTY